MAKIHINDLLPEPNVVEMEDGTSLVFRSIYEFTREETADFDSFSTQMRDIRDKMSQKFPNGRKGKQTIEQRNRKLSEELESELDKGLSLVSKNGHEQLLELPFGMKMKIFVWLAEQIREYHDAEGKEQSQPSKS